MNSTFKYEILSYSINAITPVYGSLPEPSVVPYRQIVKGDTSNSYVISIHNHTGTHIDAPKHFIDNGKSISDYSYDELIFKNPILADCPKEDASLITPYDLRNVLDLLPQGDCLLLRTGFGQFRHEERYRTNNPGIAPETILWVRKEYPNIRCIGIDSISISSYQHRTAGREAHKAAFIEKIGLGKPLLLIEDMKLDIKPCEVLKMMFIVPWLMNGLDSAPCSVLVEIS